MSLPMWGAWIETGALLEPLPGYSVAPVWERGLKLQMGRRSAQARQVALHVGVWIETLRAFVSSQPDHVAPFVEAWIETSMPM